ncbi:hypothetical protein EYC95_07790 [Pseudomonas sp. BGI-2]|nr:hypothetical protein EYC95_07790 [Pseudomonas sp. BGI-2]
MSLKTCWNAGQLSHSPCGSGLAREKGVSVDIHVADTPHSRASPLPQDPRSFQDFPMPDLLTYFCEGFIPWLCCQNLKHFSNSPSSAG